MCNWTRQAVSTRTWPSQEPILNALSICARLAIEKDCNVARRNGVNKGQHDHVA